MSDKIIPAPTQGRIVLYDAGHLRSGSRSLVVPAIVHNVIDRDRVTLVAVDDDGQPLLSRDGVSTRTALPVARFGELLPGVPSARCWCYPPRSDAQVAVRADGAGEAVRAHDFDPDATLDYSA